MIVDLYATVDRLLWALLAWIAIGAALGTVLLLGLSAAIAWIWRALHPPRGHTAAPDAPQAPDGAGEPRAPHKPAGARTATRTPAWAHTQPIDHGEAA